MDPTLKKALLQRGDSDCLARAYQGQPGYQSLRDVGQSLVKQGDTDAAELGRVVDLKPSEDSNVNNR